MGTQSRRVLTTTPVVVRPAGLMSHGVHPSDGGFVFAQVWRTEGDGRTFFDDVAHT